MQKYEKGANRISASRLQQAADILGVAVPFSFEAAVGGPYKPGGRAPSPAYIDDFVSSSDGLRLAKAFMQIENAEMRRRIVNLVQEVAGSHGD